MRVAIIGRTEILYATARLLLGLGHEIGLVVTAKEAPEYTKTSQDFRLFSEGNDIPFFHTPKISECLEILNSLPKMDIGVSYNYPGIVPQDIIECFPLGILNAHGGDLPKYRGNACQAWAILQGEDRIGLCIHRMIGGELDSGDIIARDYCPLTIDTKITEINSWMFKRIPELFVHSLERLNEDSKYILEKQSTDPQAALRCYPRKPEDGKIVWSASNVEILRLVNASNKPYAGAYCEFQGEKLIVWGAELAPEENCLAVPGQITCVSDDFVEVAAGVGKLRLKLVEFLGEVHRPNKLIRSIRQRLY